MRPRRRRPTRLLRPWDSPGKNSGVGCHFLLQCIKVKSESEVAQLCRTLSDPMDCSLPGSSINGIFQARVLEWGAVAFSQPLATTNLPSVSIDLGAFPISRIRQSVTFCAWFLLFSIMFLKFILIVAGIMTFFCFIADDIQLHVPQCIIHLSVDEHLGCFYLLALSIVLLWTFVYMCMF